MSKVELGDDKEAVEDGQHKIGNRKGTSWKECLEQH
jgi:hypothetical protein